MDCYSLVDGMRFAGLLPKIIDAALGWVELCLDRGRPCVAVRGRCVMEACWPWVDLAVGLVDAFDRDRRLTGLLLAIHCCPEFQLWFVSPNRGDVGTRLQLGLANCRRQRSMRGRGADQRLLSRGLRLLGRDGAGGRIGSSGCWKLLGPILLHRMEWVLPSDLLMEASSVGPLLSKSARRHR
ncbi:hypothetical protein ACLOJK_004806 [Asimina triloba]